MDTKINTNQSNEESLFELNFLNILFDFVNRYHQTEGIKPWLKVIRDISEWFMEDLSENKNDLAPGQSFELFIDLWSPASSTLVSDLSILKIKMGEPDFEDKYLTPIEPGHVKLIIEKSNPHYSSALFMKLICMNTSFIPRLLTFHSNILFNNETTKFIKVLNQGIIKHLHSSHGKTQAEIYDPVIEETQLWINIHGSGSAKPTDEAARKKEKKLGNITSRQVLVMHYIYKALNVCDVDETDKARLTEFLTKKTEKTVYDGTRQAPNIGANEKKSLKDLVFIKDYFVQLNLPEIVRNIEKDIDQL